MYDSLTLSINIAPPFLVEVTSLNTSLLLKYLVPDAEITPLFATLFLNTTLLVVTLLFTMSNALPSVIFALIKVRSLITS